MGWGMGNSPFLGVFLLGKSASLVFFSSEEGNAGI